MPVTGRRRDVKRYVRVVAIGLIVAMAVLSSGCGPRGRRWRFWRRHTSCPMVATSAPAQTPLVAAP